MRAGQLPWTRLWWVKAGNLNGRQEGRSPEPQGKKEFRVWETSRVGGGAAKYCRAEWANKI